MVSTVTSGAGARLSSAVPTGVTGSSGRCWERWVPTSHRHRHPWVPPKTSRPRIAVMGSPRRSEQRRSPVPRPRASQQGGHRHRPKGTARCPHIPPHPPSPQQQVLGGSYPPKSETATAGDARAAPDPAAWPRGSGGAPGAPRRTPPTAISIPAAAQPASPWRWQHKSHPHRGDRKLSSKAPSSALSHSSAPGSSRSLLAAPCPPPPIAHLRPHTLPPSPHPSSRSPWGGAGSVAGGSGAASSTLLSSPPLSRHDPPPPPPITPRDAPATTGGGNKADPRRAEDAAAPAHGTGDGVIPPPTLTCGLITAVRKSSALPRDLPGDGMQRPALRYPRGVSLPAPEEMNPSPVGCAGELEQSGAGKKHTFPPAGLHRLRPWRLSRRKAMSPPLALRPPHPAPSSPRTLSGSRVSSQPPRSSGVGVGHALPALLCFALHLN